MREPKQKIVSSSLSGIFIKGDVAVHVNIIRADKEIEWILQVVNSDGMSTVWDVPFDNDADAYAEFERVVAEEGMEAFDTTSTAHTSYVIPFRRPQ